jgi:hypothetical protein
MTHSAATTRTGCGRLPPFIDRVGAPSGKKIDAVDDAELIDEVTAVRESLDRCGLTGADDLARRGLGASDDRG